MRSLGGPLVVAVLLLVAAFLTIDRWYPYVAGTPSRPVPLAVAEKQLQRAVDAAMQGDVDRLCALATDPSFCEGQLRSAGPVPTRPPTIVSREVLLPNADNGGGTILVVEGEQVGGEPYRTEFLVSDAGRYGFRPVSPVWWSGTTWEAGPGTRAVFPRDAAAD